MDLSEEISANFEALPFAMASDSDNDAGTSVASDSGSHGPPCRIAAVVTAQQRECRIKILKLSAPKSCLHVLYMRLDCFWIMSLPLLNKTGHLTESVMKIFKFHAASCWLNIGSYFIYRIQQWCLLSLQGRTELWESGRLRAKRPPATDCWWWEWWWRWWRHS